MISSNINNANRTMNKTRAKTNHNINYAGINTTQVSHFNASNNNDKRNERKLPLTWIFLAQLLFQNPFTIPIWFQALVSTQSDSLTLFRFNFYAQKPSPTQSSRTPSSLTLFPLPWPITQALNDGLWFKTAISIQIGFNWLSRLIRSCVLQPTLAAS